jgi:hypothetical protein
MFNGGKRFAPSLLSILEPERKAADFVQGRQPNDSIDEPADGPCFTKDGGYEVESEKTYKAPVEGSDEK